MIQTGLRPRRLDARARKSTPPAQAAPGRPGAARWLSRASRWPVNVASPSPSRQAHPPSWLGYRYQQAAVIGWSSYLWLPRLRVPTLVLHGEDDPAVPVMNARMIARQIPAAELQTILGTGHMLLFGEPGKAAPVLERFLAR